MSDEISVKAKRIPKKSYQKPKEVQKNPVGRPTIYKPEYCEQVIPFMAEGKSIVAFAASIGVSRDTIYEWIRTHKEFSDSIRAGMSKSQAYWEDTIQKGCLGEIKGFNALSAIFVMKNRFAEDWREKQEVAHTGPNGGPLQIQTAIQHLSIDELYEQYNQKKLASAPKLIQD